MRNIKILIIIFIIYCQNIFSQNTYNLVPNGDFQSGTITPGCFNASNIITGQINDWVVRSHCNNCASSPDWMEVPNCLAQMNNAQYYAGCNYTIPDFPSNRFIRMGATEVLSVSIPPLTPFKRYVFKIKLAPQGTTQTDCSYNHQIQVLLSKYGEHWYRDFGNVKFTICYQGIEGSCNPGCFHWGTYYMIFTAPPEANVMTNLILYPYAGCLFIDDVEIYEYCADNIFIEDWTHDYKDHLYESDNNILSGYEVANPPNGSGNVTVDVGADVKYKAGQNVILDPGFEAKLGSEFEAYISPCGQLEYDLPQSSEQNLCLSASNNCFNIGGNYNPNLHYQWTPSTYLNNPNIPNPTVCINPLNNPGNLTYTLNVTDNLGTQIGPPYTAVIHYWQSTGPTGVGLNNITTSTNYAPINNWGCNLSITYDITKIEFNIYNGLGINNYDYLYVGVDWPFPANNNISNINIPYIINGSSYPSGTYYIIMKGTTACGQVTTAVNYTWYHIQGKELSSKSLLSTSDTVILDNYLSILYNLDKLNYDSLLYTWNFGDGTTSNQRLPIKTFRDKGIYDVSLEVTDIENIYYQLYEQKYNISSPASIYGSLIDNVNCGYNSVVKDTLVIMNNGNIVNSITPAITNENGYFNFNETELALLDSNISYTINSKSGFALSDTASKTIRQWVSESPLNSILQNVNREWAKQYNSADSLYAVAKAIDLFGNIYVTGRAFVNHSNYDIVTLKYNPQGVLLWSRLYDNNGLEDNPNAIVADSLGNIYITGTVTASNYKKDCITLKYDSSGTQQWVNIYDFHTGDDAGNAITSDGIGNVYVTGRSVDPSGSADMFTVKYSKTGSTEWLQRYDDPIHGEDLGMAIATDDYLNVYVCGQGKNSQNQTEYVVCSYSKTGALNWMNNYRFNSTSINLANDLIYNNGNIYVTGSAGTLKYNNTGTIKWSQASTNNCTKILRDGNGIIHIAGYDGLIRYDDNGNLLNSTSGVFIKDMVIDNTGNEYILSGYDGNVLSKYTNGIVNWSLPFQFNTFNYGASIALSQNENIYVCGTAMDVYKHSDIITVKYSQCPDQAFNLKVINSDNNDNKQQEKVMKISILPNPNNGIMELHYDLKDFSPAFFIIYDFTGRKVFSQQLDVNNKVLSLWQQQLNSGVYFYSLIQNNAVVAFDKIVIIK